MNLKKMLAFLSFGALTLAALLGLVAFQTVYAQETTPEAPSADAPTVKFFGRGLGGRYTSEDLANALGITVDELTTAYQAANNAALDQAVEAGLITEAQAEQLRESGTAFPFGGRWQGWLSQNGIDYEALLADALGISVEDLQTAYAQAYSTRIEQAVADGRLTQEQADLLLGEYALYNNENFQSSMQSAFEAAVNQAVTDGVISQAQADQILENASGLRFFGGGHGFHGRGFGHPGRGGGAFTAPAIPDAPVTTPSSDL